MKLPDSQRMVRAAVNLALLYRAETGSGACL
ncbi:rCG26805 [Rattus norvegicus]|uniref:RCG26805 n=1 Tax=Rattus norvegicus TaxID=10116 RepID=A6HM41_RAT|nr:rCG26805 [Rattus norvegicus]